MNFGCFFCLVCRLQCDVLARPEEGRRREAEKEGRKGTVSTSGTMCTEA